MLLFHYCSNWSFEAIVRSSQLRLSALDMSNDSSEGIWFLRAFERRLRGCTTSEEEIRKMMQGAELAARFFSAGAFCLSEEGDLLSQWRGYGDDGHGVALGFDATGLAGVGQGIALKQVEYQEERYGRVLDEIVAILAPLIRAGGLTSRGLLDLIDTEGSPNLKSRRGQIFAALSNLTLVGLHIKNPAFSEEKEWRLASLLNINNENSGFAPESCDFRAEHDRFIPFRVVGFVNRLPIRTVTLGPKNRSRADYVASFVAKQGYSGVEVKRSIATYR